MTVRKPTFDSSFFIPPWLRNRWGLAAGLAIIYLVLYAAWLFGLKGTDETLLISNVSFLPISLFAALAALRVAAKQNLDPRLRRAWFALGLGTVCQFAGNLVFFFLYSNVPGGGLKVAFVLK